MAASLTLIAAAPAAVPAIDGTAALRGAEHGSLTAVTRAGDRLVAVGVHGRVLLSDDSGKTWRLGDSGVDALLDTVLFVSDRVGYTAGQDAAILRTEDGGETWKSENGTPGSDQQIFAIAALAPDHLVVSGSYAFLAETTDGQHWSETKIPSLEDDYHLNALVRRAATLLVVGESGNAFVRDGAAWTAHPVPYEGSQFGCLVTADGTAYSFGLRGNLFRAPPGTVAWAKADSGTTQSLFAGAILPDGRIVLGGANGTLAVLARDGTHPFVTALPTTGTISGIAVAPSGDLVVAADDGVHIVPLASLSSDAAAHGAKS